jgi:MoaD family protein
MIKDVTRIPEVSIEMEWGTINDVLNILADRYGKDFWEIVFNKNGQLSGNTKILLNGTYIDYIDGLDSSISDGDSIYLFPAIGGG